METIISPNVAANSSQSNNQAIKQILPAQFPEFGFVRIWQIIGDDKRGIAPIFPISSTSWWEGVKSGIYPKPLKLSSRTTVWRAESIRKLVDDLSQAEEM